MMPDQRQGKAKLTLCIIQLHLESQHSFACSKVFGYHEIFHALVIVASALHLAAIFLLVTAA